MTPILKTSLMIASAFSGLCLASTAFAQGPANVELKHYVARVEVIPENRADVAITVRPGNNKLPHPTLVTRADTLVLDGGLKNTDHTINFSYFFKRDNTEPKGRINIRGYGSFDLKDLPLITVRVPMNVKLSSSGSGYGHIGRSQSLKLSNAGSNDWTVDPVAGKVVVENAGSGDIHLATAGAVEISSASSGDFSIGDIQSLNSSQAGSGDLRVGRIFGPAEIAIAGSGDINVKSVNGNIDISIAGSGDVHIAEGNAPRFVAGIAGSGDIRFGGTAGDVDASIAGSGDIVIARATGKVEKGILGSGSVNIGK